MNRKQLIILLVLVIVVGGAGLLIRQRSQSAWQSADKNIGQKLLAGLAINDVAHLVIKHDTNELNLARKDNLWRVRERGDYPANFQQISEFLIKAGDLKVTQSEKVGGSQLPKLALAPGQGTNLPTVVEFKDVSDKTLRSLLLGKKHMKKSERPSPMGEMGDEGWPDGRWVKVGDSDSVAVISEAFVNIEPKPDQWLNKDFIHVDKVRSLAVAFQNATNSWKLTRETETGEWKLTDATPAEKLDSAKTSSLASALGSPSFSDVAAGAKAENLGLDKPTTVTLDTFDNFTYILKVGQKTNDTYSLTLTVAAQLPKERTPGKDEKAEDKTKLDKEFKDSQKKLEDKLAQEKTYEPWTYLVSSWTFDSLLKERSQLLVEKKDETKKDDKSAGASSNSGDDTAAPPAVLAPANDK
jgi:hypothetical protein